MGKKSNKEYTTIQIRKEINNHIREICDKQGWIASTITEMYWLGLISSSESGSLHQEKICPVY